MFRAEVPAAEGAVADDVLGGLFAGCERAAEFLGGHGGEGELGEREVGERERSGEDTGEEGDLLVCFVGRLCGIG